MEPRDSKAAEIIDRLLGVIEKLLLETVAQRSALGLLCEYWPNEEKPDWHLLVGPMKPNTVQTAHDRIQELRGMLLEELSQGYPRPLQDWERIVQKLIESVKDRSE